VDSNIERTGKRDLVYSDMMRHPSRHSPGCEYLRVCDWDPTLVCHRCALPLMMIEATTCDTKSVRYTQTTAKELWVPGYLVWHDGGLIGTAADVTTVILTDSAGQKKTLTPESYYVFIEDAYREHAARCPGWASGYRQ
jgi:hypothetical protein